MTNVWLCSDNWHKINSVLCPPDENGATDLEDHVPELRLLSVWADEGEEIIESKQWDYHSESLRTQIRCNVWMKY